MVLSSIEYTAAQVPSGFFISSRTSDIVRAEGLSIRQGDSVRVRGSDVRGEVLRSVNLALAIAGNNSSRAGIGFLDSVDSGDFRDRYDGELVNYSGLLVWAGPTRIDSEIGLCHGSGAVVVQWRQGGQDRACGQGFEERSRVSDQFRLHGATDSTILQAAKSLLLSQSSAQIGRYCSSIARGDGTFGWGSILTGSDWDLFSSEDPCAQADEICRQSSRGSRCAVVNLGEWAVNDPEVVVAFECANNQVFSSKGAGTQVSTIVDQLAQDAQQADFCALSIYSADSVLFEPQTNAPTIVKTEEVGNDVRVNALEGNLLVRSAIHPQGLVVSEGQAYLSSSGQVVSIDRTALLNSPDVQEALNPDNWLPLPQTDPPLPSNVADQLADQLNDSRTAADLSPSASAGTSSVPNLTGEWTFDFGFFSFDPSDPVNTCVAAPELGPYQGQISITQTGNQLSISAPPEVPMTTGTVSGVQFTASGPSPMRWTGTISGDGNYVSINGNGNCGSASIPFQLYSVDPIGGTPIPAS